LLLFPILFLYDVIDKIRQFLLYANEKDNTDNSVMSTKYIANIILRDFNIYLCGKEFLTQVLEEIFLKDFVSRLPIVQILKKK
jgi:hypothetical protein